MYVIIVNVYVLTRNVVVVYVYVLVHAYGVFVHAKYDVFVAADVRRCCRWGLAAWKRRRRVDIIRRRRPVRCRCADEDPGYGGRSGGGVPAFDRGGDVGVCFGDATQRRRHRGKFGERQTAGEAAARRRVERDDGVVHDRDALGRAAAPHERAGGAREPRGVRREPACQTQEPDDRVRRAAAPDRGDGHGTERGDHGGRHCGHHRVPPGDGGCDGCDGCDGMIV